MTPADEPGGLAVDGPADLGDDPDGDAAACEGDPGYGNTGQDYPDVDSSHGGAEG